MRRVIDDWLREAIVVERICCWRGGESSEKARRGERRSVARVLR
jgi:hypothetical protein